MGAKFRKSGADVFALVVDSGVEMRLLDEPIAFLLAARRADDAAALDLGDLTGDRTGGAGGARYHNGLAGFDLADLRYPEIRRQSIDAEQAGVVSQTNDRRKVSKSAMELRDLDLNLLLVLDALFEEGTLTRTAQRLRLSQPTVSASLVKLRGILGDELFVRANGKMQPTARALALRGAVASVLKTVDQPVDRPPLDLVGRPRSLISGRLSRAGARTRRGPFIDAP